MFIYKKPHTSLQESLDLVRNDDAFQNYLVVKDYVLRLFDQFSIRNNQDDASHYWEEELAGFDYMLDASPLIIRKLREHCYHLTGIRSYEYRGHHVHDKKRFTVKLHALRHEDAKGLFIPEAPELGGFGHEIEGTLVNIDTLKFYEVLIALDKAGILSGFEKSERKLVVEIGAGWGGFAYQFKTLFPNTCYVIVDLPATLLFSAVYLKTLFKEANIGFVDSNNSTAYTKPEALNYDFIFLPHFLFNELALPQLDLAINMVSFQEMTTQQVEGYVKKLHSMNCPTLYSLNRERSRHNTQLSTVSSILAMGYSLEEIKVLDIPYTTLSRPSWRTRIRKQARNLLKGSSQNIFDYRHIVARRQGDKVLA